LASPEDITQIFDLTYLKLVGISTVSKEKPNFTDRLAETTSQNGLGGDDLKF